MPAAHVVKPPDTIDFDTAAAMMLQGLTVHICFVVPFPCGTRSRLYAYDQLQQGKFCRAGQGDYCRSGSAEGL